MSAGTVYVIVESEWPSGDVAGCLMLDSGEVLWGHMSSNRSWLQRDLTDGFRDRRQKLVDRYPDGYSVVVVDGDGQIPADVEERNKAWAAEVMAAKPPCNGHCDLASEPGLVDADCPQHGNRVDA